MGDPRCRMMNLSGTQGLSYGGLPPSIGVGGVQDWWVGKGGGGGGVSGAFDSILGGRRARPRRGGKGGGRRGSEGGGKGVRGWIGGRRSGRRPASDRRSCRRHLRGRGGNETGFGGIRGLEDTMEEASNTFAREGNTDFGEFCGVKWWGRWGRWMAKTAMLNPAPPHNGPLKIDWANKQNSLQSFGCLMWEEEFGGMEWVWGCDAIDRSETEGTVQMFSVVQMAMGGLGPHPPGSPWGERRGSKRLYPFNRGA